MSQTSATVNANPAPGVSAGTAVQEMTRLARELDVPFEWTAVAFLQVQAGNVALLIFGLGTVLVYPVFFFVLMRFGSHKQGGTALLPVPGARQPAASPWTRQAPREVPPNQSGRQGCSAGRRTDSRGTHAL